MKMRIVLMILAVFILSGCSSTVQIHYYRISSADTAIDQDPIPFDIAVENFRSSPPLRRNEIVFREGKNELALSSTNLWWALPEEMVSEAFISFLQRSEAFRHIFHYPSPYLIDYRLEGFLDEFEIYRDNSEQWRAHVALQVRLLDARQNKIVWNSGVLQRQLVAEPTIKAAIAKIDEALLQIFSEIVQNLRQAATQDRGQSNAPTR